MEWALPAGGSRLYFRRGYQSGRFFRRVTSDSWTYFSSSTVPPFGKHISSIDGSIGSASIWTPTAALFVVAVDAAMRIYPDVPLYFRRGTNQFVSSVA
jgi:hypothetical protein